mgnify:CR=1 FL=1
MKLATISREKLNERTRWGRNARNRMHGSCMGCGKKKSGLQIHEIERRSHAPGRWAHRCNYLLLCATCHGWTFDCMPHSQQLTHKLYWDPEHFDLEKWLRIRDPDLVAPRRIEMAEIIMWIPELKERFG